MSWWGRHSLRSRLMLVSVGGLSAGLAVGGAVVVAALGATLQRSVDAEATQTGEDVARLVDAGQLPEPVPVAGEQLVQVVDGQSRVLAASINVDRLVPMLRDGEIAEVRDGERLYIDGERLGLSGQVRVVGVPAGGPDNPRTVLVAKPMADLRRSMQAARTILLVAFPLLVAGLAVATWRVVGATLRPVEALRAGAAEITATGRGRHGLPASLPVPEYHDEIHRLAVTLNDMLDRLAAARSRQRAFVADAAHELRSPLANMRTQLEVAQHIGDRTDWPQVARDLLTDTQRLSRLVDDLLLLARADDARPDDRSVELVELGGLLRAVAERYPAPPPVRVVDGPPVWTEGEPEALRRVVTNLVDNAVRHARSRVDLAAARDGRHQLVTVTDDGPGIPVADRGRVFDRFTRLDNARARDAGGAGLGLAIVRELVRRHGGTVRLTDADPAADTAPAPDAGPAADAGSRAGLRVEVRLPAAPDP